MPVRVPVPRGWARVVLVSSVGHVSRFSLAPCMAGNLWLLRQATKYLNGELIPSAGSVPGGSCTARCRLGFVRVRRPKELLACVAVVDDEPLNGVEDALQVTIALFDGSSVLASVAGTESGADDCCLPATSASHVPGLVRR